MFAIWEKVPSSFHSREWHKNVYYFSSLKTYAEQACELVFLFCISNTPSVGPRLPLSPGRQYLHCLPLLFRDPSVWLVRFSASSSFIQSHPCDRISCGTRSSSLRVQLGRSFVARGKNRGILTDAYGHRLCPSSLPTWGNRNHQWSAIGGSGLQTRESNFSSVEKL